MGKHAILLLKKLQRALLPASDTISGSIRSSNNGSVSRERVHDTKVPRGFESIYLRLKRNRKSLLSKFRGSRSSCTSSEPFSTKKKGWGEIISPGDYERHENKGESMPINKKIGVSPLTIPLHQWMASGISSSLIYKIRNSQKYTNKRTQYYTRPRRHLFAESTKGYINQRAGVARFLIFCLPLTLHGTKKKGV